jgi:hypothetical protein
MLTIEAPDIRRVNFEPTKGSKGGGAPRNKQNEPIKSMAYQMTTANKR